MNMGKMQRSKGARVEREIVNLHHDIGIAASKDSRSGYTGPDLLIGDELICEVKARRNGEGFGGIVIPRVNIIETQEVI